MLNRATIATLMTILLGLCASPASAAPPTDFWQNKQFMNMAHAGGAKEGPANTLFAFKQAVKNGADSLEMDGYVTADGVFVVTHDLDPYSTSNIQYTDYSGMEIGDMTLAQLKTLDFAYKFKPGEGHFDFHADDPDDLYPYRGMALEGGPQPPAGYTRNDFRIATFKEVLDAFPHTPINIDMKAPYSNQQMATDAADVLADLMADYPERTDDVIVASFFQGAMERFHELLPSHHALTASEDALLGYVQGNPITPVPVALQPPDNYDLPPVLDTVPILKPKAEADGYAIHVWPQNGSVDGPELWQKMIDQGADGFFTDFPSQMHQFLCEKGIPRPDGSPRCAEQRCPDGYDGIAPDDCHRVCLDGFEVVGDDCRKLCPVGTVQQGNECACPPGMVGTPPKCEPHGDPATIVKKLTLRSQKKVVKAGQKIRFRVKVRAKLGMISQVRLRIRSSSRRVRAPKSVLVRFKRPAGQVAVAVATFKVRVGGKARGRAKIAVRSGKVKARSKIRVVGPRVARACKKNRQFRRAHRGVCGKLRR